MCIAPTGPNLLPWASSIAPTGLNLLPWASRVVVLTHSKKNSLSYILYGLDFMTLLKVGPTRISTSFIYNVGLKEWLDDIISNHRNEGYAPAIQ
jgi:hypothetical protein